jgi:DMSO/TMAO reductase YedYZ molybdopterin-dependent catalytic subunit
MKPAKLAILGLVVGAILIGSAFTYVIVEYLSEEPIEWEIKLVGSHGEEQIMSYDQIRHMPYKKAMGGLLTSAGIIYGPYEVKGVLLRDLCDIVGGITSNDFVSVSAIDGYSMAFDYEQIYFGGFPAWNPATLQEIPNQIQMIMLTYEWDGKPIHNNDGGPLRLVIVTNESLLTEGHNWVMWVDEITIKSRE